MDMSNLQTLSPRIDSLPPAQRSQAEAFPFDAVPMAAAETFLAALESAAKLARAATPTHGAPTFRVGEKGTICVQLPGYRRPITAYRAAWLRILAPESLAGLLRLMAGTEGETSPAAQSRGVPPTVKISSKGDLAQGERLKSESLLKGYGLDQPE